MISKVFQAGNSLAVSLPREFMEMLELGEGSELAVVVDLEARRIVFSLVEPGLVDIDPVFARQLAEFIVEYRPALAALAR